MSYRRAVPIIVAACCFLVQAGVAHVSLAQLTNWGTTMLTWKKNTGYVVGGCASYPDASRTIWVPGFTAGSNDVTDLVVAINMTTTDPDLMELPFSIIVTGASALDPAPPGIAPIEPSENCWWYSKPRYSVSAALSADVASDPANPSAATGTWRAFKIPLSGDMLDDGQPVSIDFSLTHRGTGTQVLDAVTAVASGFITAPTAAGPAAVYAPPETTWTFVVPGRIATEFSKMHFVQHPDTSGLDVDFTYPKVVADDWMCVETGPVDDIKFWFSAQGDWFDPEGDLGDQISNIHMEIRPRQSDTIVGDTLWTGDFSPDAPNVSIQLYGQGDQGWCEPDSVYWPLDHANIYECRVVIPDPFVQHEDSTYWLAISIATDDSTSPTLKLGWKTADLDRYPMGFGSEHFLSSPVTAIDPDSLGGSIVEPGVDDFCLSTSPDSARGFDLAFALDHLVILPEEPVCHNGVWEFGEWCGRDCYVTTGYADMNYDCVVNLFDFLIFAEEFSASLMGPGLSSDFNDDWLVDLTDFAVLALSFGQSVTPCSGLATPQPACQGLIALTDDSSTVNSSITATPYVPNSAYVVVDGWEDASVLEYSVATSSNIWILSRTQYPTISQVEIVCDPDQQHSYRVFAHPAGSWSSGRVVFEKIDYYLTDANPAWIEIAPIASCPSDRIRWAKDTSGRSYDFSTISNLGINGAAVPTSGTTCQLTGVDDEDDAPAAFRLGQNHPNPFNPTTTIPYQLSQPEHVTISVYNVRGELVRALVDDDRPTGWFNAVWDGRNDRGARVASGIYFYQMRAGSFVQTKKLVLLK